MIMFAPIDYYHKGKVVKKLGKLPTGKFKQADVFRVMKEVSESERGKLLNIEELCEFGHAVITGKARSTTYAVYRVDGKPFGKSIAYVEGGNEFVFKVPDVANPLNNKESVQKAVGKMLILDMEQLTYDEEKGIVEVSSDFDGKIRIVDVDPSKGLAKRGGLFLPIGKKARKEGSRTTYMAYEEVESCWHGSIAVSYYSDRVLIVGVPWDAETDLVGLGSIEQC
ncbi:MAG: hypothetical protein D6769_02560 [Methanobacteriota archaeon]|nr:MAG: hypothetical protein D6769_02560 [Euryarchaeota archaeon]